MKNSKDYSMFGVGMQGKSPNVTAQKKINLYYEIQPVGDETRVAIYGTPGLELFVDFGDTPVRGMYAPQWNNLLYVVHRGTLWEVNNSGTKTSRGTLSTTSGHVSISDNGTQIIIVDGTYGYIWNTSTLAFSVITFGFTILPTTVTFESGRFIVNNNFTGQFFISSSYDGLTWNALDYATAESNPDSLIAVWSDHGEVVLFGDISTEFWVNTGAQDFPYSRLSGATAEWGLASAWSVAKFDNSLMLLAKNRMGEVIVGQINGYQIKRVSNNGLEYLINSYNSVSDATAFSYMLGGHPMYEISFPSAGYSWLYDGSTGIWSQLQSNNMTRHRVEKHAGFINKNIVSDYSSGKLYYLSGDVYSENGEILPFEIQGRHIASKQNLVSVSQFELVMETGVGVITGQGSDPQVILKISRDNGHTFGSELGKSIGAIGGYANRVVWRRLGSGRDIVLNLKITDPVKRVITGAILTAKEGIS